ncbi:HNH endonuclease [Paraglaciecola aquimarina]|uniref:HNH endonuclease n=1 Tax=Paraglaciecola algarum TaxID=3050085 RepID=A0ABS9D3R3_9ALTE|nr:HNH endonuclease signature motif containing protein [Paraglaciecola sp. G1-23]MCF2947578.1 HNH endonuclease [Paraglaciecola sp. G1-23]
MFEVTYKLSSCINRKKYKTENGALRAIWRWLIKNEHESYKLALLYAPHEDVRDYQTAEELPFEKVEDKVVDFYASNDWLKLRYLAFEKFGNQCSCCGNSPVNGAVLHVDHIKPRSQFPELAFDINNLQVLCGFCNLGKSNKFDTQWR